MHLRPNLREVCVFDSSTQLTGAPFGGVVPVAQKLITGYQNIIVSE